MDQGLVRILRVSDLLGLSVAFVLSLYLVHPLFRVGSLEQLASVRAPLGGIAAFVCMMVFWGFVFKFLRLYDGSRRLLEGTELLKAWWVSSVCVLSLVLVAMGIRAPVDAPHFAASFWLLGSGAVLAPRVLLRSLLRQRGRDHHVLVVGTGPTAIRFAEAMRGKSTRRLRLIGFADEDWPGMQAFRATQQSVVTDLKNFPSFARDRVIDEIVIAAPASVLMRWKSQVIDTCQEHGISVRILPDVLSEIGIWTPRTVGSDPAMLRLSHRAVDGAPLAVKRAIDVVLALGLLVLLAPVFPIVSLLIRAGSPGPALFGQERVGFRKRRFRMLKFRTMIEHAEDRIQDLDHLNELDGPVFKTRDDPRITTIGRWLRTTSIDELPQLINILRGEMSLVGPRPLPLRDVAGFDDDQHRRRFSVRPGLTGLWQVSGRSSLSFERWMELDLLYVDHWSLGLDLEILLRTIPAVLTRKGAE